MRGEALFITDRHAGSDVILIVGHLCGIGDYSVGTWISGAGWNGRC